MTTLNCTLNKIIQFTTTGLSCWICTIKLVLFFQTLKIAFKSQEGSLNSLWTLVYLRSYPNRSILWKKKYIYLLQKKTFIDFKLSMDGDGFQFLFQIVFSNKPKHTYSENSSQSFKDTEMKVFKVPKAHLKLAADDKDCVPFIRTHLTKQRLVSRKWQKPSTYSSDKYNTSPMELHLGSQSLPSIFLYSHLQSTLRV